MTDYTVNPLATGKKKEPWEEALLDPMEQYRQQFVLDGEQPAATPAAPAPAPAAQAPAQPPTGPAPTHPEPAGAPARPPYSSTVPPPPPPPPPPPAGITSGTGSTSNPAQPPSGSPIKPGDQIPADWMGTWDGWRGSAQPPTTGPITPGDQLPVEQPDITPGDPGAGGFDPAENPNLFDQYDLEQKLAELTSRRAPTANAPAGRTGGMGSELEAFAREGLANPSRWDQELVKETLGLIDQDTARSRDAGQRAVSEQMAARGTLGSSVEWDDLNKLETQLSEIEAKRRNDLAREVANTTGADRTAAAGIGLGVGQFGEQRYQFDAQNQLARDAMTLDAYKTDLNAGMQATQMRLQELGMRSDEAFRYSQLAQDGEFRQKTMDLQAEGMKLDEAFRQAELELKGDLGRGELAIREKEAQAKIQSMDVARFAVVGDFVLRALEAGIPPDQIEAAIAAYLAGDSSAFDGFGKGYEAKN